MNQVKENNMVQEKNFSIMCSEVLEVLKYCPKRYINKIPTNMKMLLNDNKDFNHKIKINPNGERQTKSLPLF